MAHTRRRRSAGARTRSDKGDTFKVGKVKQSPRAHKRQAKVLLVIGPTTEHAKSQLHRRCKAATMGAQLRFVPIPFAWFGGQEFIGAANGVDVDYLFLKADIPVDELDKPIGESSYDWVQIVRERLEGEFDFRLCDVAGVLVQRFEGLLNDFRDDIIPHRDDLVFLFEK